MAGRVLIVVAAVAVAFGAIASADLGRPIGASDITYTGRAVEAASAPSTPTTPAFTTIAPETQSATTPTAPPPTTPPATTPTAPPPTTPPESTPTAPPPTTQPATQPPATQPATSTAPPPTVDSIEARGARALARITYPWRSQLPGWTIEFLPGRPGAYGYTYTDQRRIEILVRDDQSDSLLAHVVAHELGHAVDVTLNSSADRQRWQDTRGIADAPWWPGSGATDFSTGAGDFAEAFAAWQIGSGSFRSNLAGPPDADQLALMAELAG